MSNKETPEKKRVILKRRSTDNENNKDPKDTSIWTYVFSVIIIFLVLSSIYSYFSSSASSKNEMVPISQLSTDIKSGLVKSVTVHGDSLDIIYKNGNKKSGKKEETEALSQTLVNYGVTKDQLGAIQIDIQNENGIAYWFISLAPIIFPILFILIFIWFITRQVKGAGIQALTFGQSKARMIDPNDKSQRVTLKM
jgi:cell division protease FtsH